MLFPVCFVLSPKDRVPQPSSLSSFWENFWCYCPWRQHTHRASLEMRKQKMYLSPQLHMHMNWRRCWGTGLIWILKLPVSVAEASLNPITSNNLKKFPCTECKVQFSVSISNSVVKWEISQQSIFHWDQQSPNSRVFSKPWWADQCWTNDNRNPGQAVGSQWEVKPH